METIWNGSQLAKQTLNAAPAMLKVNIRRIVLMMDEHKMRPAWFRHSKRSLRRWRHKPGGWVYPPRLVEAYEQAMKDYRALTIGDMAEKLRDRAEETSPTTLLISPENFAGYPVTDRYARKS